jgi:hypothetical protein
MAAVSSATVPAGTVDDEFGAEVYSRRHVSQDQAMEVFRPALLMARCHAALHRHTFGVTVNASNLSDRGEPTANSSR